ncbi:MAG: endonuclease domain-containing protein [Pseudorhodoplanes sp.]
MERFKSRAQALRERQTSAESRLWHALRNRRLSRWKFRRQHPIDRYIVDFVTLDGKLVVEIDGATHVASREIKRDEARTRLLESFGFHVIRFSNSEIYENLSGVLDAIDNELKLAGQ